MVDVRAAAAFFWARAQYVALRRVCNWAVYWHVRSTPRRATDDTLRQIAQENLALAVRKLEFKCHGLQLKYEMLGREILDDATTSE